jgi:glycosyltransferase involved in cell wall biosynthesis
MKKVVIVTRRLIMGGIEKALISMLEAMPEKEYDITLLVMGMGGELSEQLPNNVRVRCIYGNERTTLEKITKTIIKGKPLLAFKIAWYSIIAKKADSIFDTELIHSKLLPVEETEYDLAIAYHVPASFPVVYVINNIIAKKKIAWIHSDVSKYKSALQRYSCFYKEFDKIFCVSKNALTNFVELFPELEAKTDVFYNILDQEKITSLSSYNESFKDNFTGIRILTIGRLTFEKGHDLIPPVLKKIKSTGYSVRWYCIGEGECQENLQNLIKDYNIEEDLILLGMKENPYPYLKDCDIYIQPSRHEGYCITLAEARALNKAIITTNSIGAREQITNEKNGLIVNFNVEDMSLAVQRLILEKELREKLITNLKGTNDYVNEIYKLKEI